MSLVIITDAHVSAGTRAAEAFFRMLAKLSAGPHGVIFLGDIFDLWIALPRYETGLQHEFLKWCRREKARRTVGYVEGNHEFFVADGHADSFTWCTAGPWWRDEQNNLYVHGDQLNPRDRRYLLFRRLTKNRVTRILLGHLPRGPQLCERLKRALRQTNLEHRRQIPAAAIRAFAERMFAAGCGTIFLGHFHQAHRFENDKAATLYVLPAWYQKAEITLVSATGASARNIAWQSL